MSKNTFKKLLLASLVLRIFVAFLPSPVHTDLRNSLDWGERLFLYGTKGFYLGNVWSWDWPNQPPGTILLYGLINKLHGLIYNFFWFLNVNISVFPSKVMYLLERDFIPGVAVVAKIPTLLADLGIGFFIYKLISEASDKKKARWGTILFLFNPVIWYNSVIWGQYESVNNLFAIASFYFLIRRKLNWAVVSFIFSIYVKLSLIIFAPILIIFALNQKYSLRDYLKVLAVGVAFTYLIFVPFSRNNTFWWAYDLYKSKVLTDQLQIITANAFNLWAGISGIHATPHDNVLGYLPFKMWGNILYGVSYLGIIIGLLGKKDTKTVFWSLSLVSFSTFMLLTNMHERYLYPFFTTFVVIAAINNANRIYYYLLSGINLLNLYNFWWYPKIGIIVLLLSVGDRLLPRLLGFGSFVIYLFLYRKYIKEINFARNFATISKKIKNLI